MATKTVHFTVEGAGLTNLLRQLWAEGKAYNALEPLHGLDMEVRFDILEGRRKLTGDTRTDETLCVESDSYDGVSREEVWDLILAELANAVYFQYADRIPTITKNMLHLKKAAGIKIDENAALKAAVDALREEYEREEEEEEEEEEDSIISEFHKEIGFDAASRQYDPEWSTKATIEEIGPGKVLLIQQTRTNGRELSITHKLYQEHRYNATGLVAEDPRSTKYNSAWISPDGEFYGMPDLWHATVAVEILELLGRKPAVMQSGFWRKGSGSNFPPAGLSSRTARSALPRLNGRRSLIGCKTRSMPIVSPASEFTSTTAIRILPKI
ncbi:MAG TPA: hypothetical protein PLI53_08645 [Geobacteraceae bacterium]|nr:hypothetical protein [Geobacteraceae bacterium]